MRRDFWLSGTNAKSCDVRSDIGRRTWLVEETVNPLARKTLAPTPDRLLAADSKPIVDSRVRGPSSRHQDHPRTQRQRLGG